MMAPLVSVIIPTFNRAGTVRRSIDSALEQSYRPIEVIVVDDGSTDGTRAVLSSYGDRIRPIYQANCGPSAARNTGAFGAHGEFIAFLDSDDTWQPTKIARQVRLMLEGGEGVPCGICNALLIDSSELERTTFQVSNVMSGLHEGFWMNPAPILATRFILFNQVAMIRRDAFEKVGGFKPEMRLLEDYDLAFRLSLLGPWAFVEDPLVEKYNDTDGIGVVAMLDPLVHARAWLAVLGGFLSQYSGSDPEVRQLLKCALAEVKVETRAEEMLKESGSLGRLAARCRLVMMRKQQALRRRMPGWPRIHAVASLPSISLSVTASAAFPSNVPA
ncbi:MAG: glycosyltransferase family A protein [Luteolibacter sp.]